MQRSRYFADQTKSSSILDLSSASYSSESSVFEAFEPPLPKNPQVGSTMREKAESIPKSIPRLVLDSSDEEEEEEEADTTQEVVSQSGLKLSSSSTSTSSSSSSKAKKAKEEHSDSEDSIILPKKFKSNRNIVVLDSDTDTDEREKAGKEIQVKEADTSESDSSSDEQTRSGGKTLTRKKKVLTKKSETPNKRVYDLDSALDEFRAEFAREKDNRQSQAKRRKLEKKKVVQVLEESEEDESGGEDYSGSDEEDAVGELFERCEKISEKLLAHINRTSLDHTTMSAKKQRKPSRHRDEEQGDADESDDIVISRENADKLFPTGLSLKEYQLVGLNWLQVLYSQDLNGILADEMGLGKTVQAIAVLAWLDKHKDIRGPHLIVAPGSTLENWRRELERWVPNHRIVLFHGSQKERTELIQQEMPQGREKTAPFDILLTTYTYFERDSCSADRSFIGKFKFHYIITDEAHGIKNMNSSRYKRLTRVRSKRRLLLSGTPVQNNLEELLALMSFCMPKVFDASSDQLGEYFRSKGEGEIERIRNALKPFVLRRLKCDVLGQLSPKVESVRMLETVPEQRELYDTIVNDYRQRRTTGQGLSTRAFVHFFSELRKAANHPLLVQNYFGKNAAQSKDGVDRSMDKVVSLLHSVRAFGPDATLKMIESEVKTYSDWDLHLMANQYGSSSAELRKMKLPDDVLWTSSKARELKTLLPKLIKGGHRFLIFSQWTTILDLIQEMLQAMSISYVRFDGQTAVSERQDIIDQYNNDLSISGCLLSTRAGGMGINLTSADTVILHDLDFNPSLDRQAEDRCHRIGQTKTVTVYKLVCKDTVDENILHIQTKKKQLDESLLSANGTTPVKKGAKASKSSDPIKLIMERI